MGEQRNINTGGGDARETHNQGQYAEGNIDNRRYQQGIIANDNATINIETLYQHFHFENPFPDGVPFKAPPIPKHFVPRPLYSDVIREQLLSAEANQLGTLVVSAIQGLGGIGKSVMAAALAHEPAIAKHFPNGVLWVTLGQKPDLLPLLGDWIFKLGDRQYKPTTVEAASDYLRSLLADKTMLLVVDDLWNASHFEPFRLAGKGCRVLVTTREVRLKDSQRIELAEMSLVESVALVQKRLDRELDEAEREEFVAFAQAVGYLPLALELGAVQIEDGYYDWHTLLEAFEEEFDILDLEGDEISENDRRKYSLRACFNLSLKRLKPEQVRQFAWLGVLPEDVSVDARSVATLWDTKPGAAKKGLIGLHRRALLLAGVPVSVNGRSEPTFRQHDLLHDLAVELVAASPSAALTGLGLSIEAAHGELLERYRPGSGHWWELNDDGYIHRRLTWHLEKAGRIREMHELIRAVDENGRNAWMEVCEQTGSLTVFVEDVARAWRCAEEVYGVIPTEAEGWRWQFWCAFAMGSMNSLVGDIPGELLATAVRQGHWSEARAVAYALQKREGTGKSQAFANLVQELRHEESINKVIQSAQEMVQAKDRDRIFVAAVKSLQQSSSIKKKLQLVNEISEHSERASALMVLVGYLPDESLAKVQKIIQGFPKDLHKAQVLSSMAEKLPSRTYGEVLELTHQISCEYFRVMPLKAFTEILPNKLIDKAIEVIQSFSNDSNKVLALIAIAKNMHTGRHEDLVNIIQKIPNKYQKAWALSEFPRKSNELLTETLKLASEIKREDNRATILKRIAKENPEMTREALELTQCIQHKVIRADVLSSLLSEELNLEEPSIFEDILNILDELKINTYNNHKKINILINLARTNSSIIGQTLELISREFSRRLYLVKLIENVPDTSFARLLDIAQSVANESYRQEIVSALAEKISHDLQGEILDMILNFSNKKHIANTLRAFLKHLPNSHIEKILDSFLLAPGLYPPGDYHGSILISLCERFEESQFKKILGVVEKIPNACEKAEILKKLASNKAFLFNAALQAHQRIFDKYEQAQTQNLLCCHGVKDSKEILDIAQEISNSYQKSKVLIAFLKNRKDSHYAVLKIANQMSDYCKFHIYQAFINKKSKLFEQEIDLIYQIKDESYRVWLQVVFAIQYSKLSPEVFKSARRIPDAHYRAGALFMLAEKQPAIYEEVLESICEITREADKAQSLIFLASKLPDELHGRALDIVCSLPHEFNRSIALSSLIPSLPPKLIQRSFYIASRISNESSRARVFSVLIPKLKSNLLQQMSNLVNQISDPFARSIALIAFAERQPKPSFKVLETCREISNEFYRAKALVEFAKKLPLELLAAPRSLAIAIRDPYHRAQALTGFTDPTSWQTIATDHNQNLLRLLSTRDRKHLIELLPKLHPTLLQLGGQPAVDAAIEAMRDACNQWP